MGKDKIWQILAFLLFSALLLPVNAQQPVYNFGSAQTAKEMSIIPGESLSTKLFFYNVFGNKITYIKLDATELPEGWKVTIDPPIHNVTYRIAEVEAVDLVNLYVEPTNYTDSPPNEPNSEFPCGDYTCTYIMSPAGKYMLAKVVNVKVEVPLSTQLFKDYTLTVSGVASWHGEPGMVTATQERSFQYKVHTIAKSGSTEEEIVSKGATGFEKYYPFVALALVIAAGVLIYRARPSKAAFRPAGQEEKPVMPEAKKETAEEKLAKRRKGKKSKKKGGKRAKKRGKRKAGRK